MFLLTGDKHSCTGCVACVNICSRRCISMQEDEDGYVFPFIDKSNCINCHQCEKVCPIEHVPEQQNGLSNYEIIAAMVKSEDLLLSSASGGAFTEIVNSFMENGDCYIWGAAYDEQLNVKHICSYCDEQLDRIRGSKYVQSDIGNCYHKIMKQLAQGARVLFSGTPCQVAALRSFLKNCNTDNLFCVDLLCHGVPSQRIFDNYIDEESKRYKSKITGVRFHYKIKSMLGKWTTRNVELTTEDGKKHIQNRYHSSFLRAYHPYLINRESCYRCIFAQPIRQGDLTIGDFWSIQKFYPQLIVEHGVSLVQTNTIKGAEMLETLKKKMDWYPIDREQYTKATNGSLARAGGVKMNLNREHFLAVFRECGMKKAVNSIYPLRADWIKYCGGKIKRVTKKLIKAK